MVPTTNIMSPVLISPTVSFTVLIVLTVVDVPNEIVLVLPKGSLSVRPEDETDMTAPPTDKVMPGVLGIGGGLLVFEIDGGMPAGLPSIAVGDIALY